jgi:hypothetical protein
MNRIGSERHLAPDDLAAYLDRTLSAEHRSEVEAHLALCDDCRDELRDIRAILRGAQPKRRRTTWVGPAAAAAAAAAIILMIAVPRGPSPSNTGPAHRDTPVSVDQRPGIGTTEYIPDQPGTYLLSWSRIDRADRYRVSIFDTTGTAVWRTETRDTSAILPPSAGIAPGSRYLWRVDARVGIDRWVESTLEPLVLGEVIPEPMVQEPVIQEPVIQEPVNQEPAP